MGRYMESKGVLWQKDMGCVIRLTIAFVALTDREA